MLDREEGFELTTQTFKLYYTDVPQPPNTTPDMAKLVPLQFATREHLIAGARKLKAAGAVIWRIEEPDGAGFDRADVEAALRGERMQFNASPQGSLVVDTWPSIFKRP